MNEITSLTNDKVKYWVKLNKDNKNEDLFIIENEHLVSEALSLGLVKEIITCDDFIVNDVLTTKVTYDIMKKISNFSNPSRIMAVVRKLVPRDILGNVIILDRIQDPGNLGTIIRSAVAFNIDTIVLGSGCVDLYNSKVIQATQGMLFKVNIIKSDIVDIIKKLKDLEYSVIATRFVDAVPLEEVKKLDKFAVVIGNEGSGVSQEVIDLCNGSLYIKMNDKCESLNASVAASIIMYELGK